MFQIKALANADFFPTLVSDPVYLRSPALGDHPDWAALRQRSRGHLTAWEDDWSPDDLGFPAFRQRLKLFDREAKRRRGLSLFIFLQNSRVLVGGVTLTNIRYGAARAGVLGY